MIRGLKKSYLNEYTTHDGKKTFKVGGYVEASEVSDFAHLKGSIVQIQPVPEEKSDREDVQIVCSFDLPEPGTSVYKSLEGLVEYWPGAKRVEDLPIRRLIMEPDEIEPISCKTNEEREVS